MKPVVVILILILTIMMLSSCDLLRGNKFEITNETGYELKDVKVSFANVSVQSQSLGPGETLSFRPSPDHDGGIGVSYMENGKLVEHDLGYVAPPISMRCEFQITRYDLRGGCD